MKQYFQNQVPTVKDGKKYYKAVVRDLTKPYDPFVSVLEFSEDDLTNNTSVYEFLEYASDNIPYLKKLR